MKPENQYIPPYTSIEEHLCDCLSWLDEYLDFCSNQKDLLKPSPITSGRYLLARQENTPQKLLPFARLSGRFHLTDFDTFMVLLALAPELDLKYEYIYSSLQGNPSCLHPTLGLARNLFSYFKPVDLSQLESITDSHSHLNQYLFDQTAACTDGDTMLHRNLVLKRNTIRYLLGYHDATGMESPYMSLLPYSFVSDFICYPKQYHMIRQILSCLGENQTTPPHPHLLLHLSGARGTGRKYLLSQILCDSSRQIVVVNMYYLYHMDADKFQLALENLAIEAVLWERFIYLDYIHPESDDEAFRLHQTITCLSKNCSVLFLTSQEEYLPELTDAAVIHIPFPLPDSDIRGKLWVKLGAGYLFDDSTTLEYFGHHYRLTPGQTARILEEASETARGQGNTSIPASAVTAAISRNQILSFHSLAARTNRIYTWDDLQLSPDARRVLHSACSRLTKRYQVEEQWGFGQKSAYGKGLSLLFYGPPGTGKTMAAQVIARETGLELYRVDLSQIFNKYIGETEKNIGRIFEEAKKADIILFFDEADSLFSKRTEVSSSNDRHSNAEISYLLQKMEEHDGVTILSTNLYQNFDPAFLRRITYTVHFDMPDERTRLSLWQSMIPASAPVSPQVDFCLLARQFELSGSSIKSILRSAAYLAAENDCEIQSKHIIQAMKYEFLKTGKIISNEEFGEYSIYI